MERGRWDQIERLYHEALARPTGERREFLAAACGDDHALRREVETLLDTPPTADGVFGRLPAAHLLSDPEAHSLSGRRLGPYRVGQKLGEGGMGEVYRARDTKLGRDVALKILPPLFISSPERRTRFEREARMLAALNHPNIGAIYGFEEAGGVAALVLELVEGETLAERIRRGPVPVPEALAIARQMAGALEAAHERGIIHRDLKPANVKLTPGGVVKVLDFGLAKAGERSAPHLSESPAITVGGTREGVILGTAAYMSPEQARGQAVDKRTDIWAFGCVLFELLTGKAPFAGDNVSDVIANVLQKAPNWSTLPAAAAPVTRILERCLEKDVNRRLRDVGDVALLFDDAIASGAQAAPPALARGTRRWWPPAAVVAALAAGGGLVAVFQPPRVPAASEPVERFQLAPPPDEPFAADTLGPNVVIAPDGSAMVYTSNRNGTVGLIVRRFDELHGREISGAEGATNPTFSPDGKEIAFKTFTELRRAAVDGTPSVMICSMDPYFSGMSWGSPGEIVYTDYSFGLFRVPVSGGRPEKIVAPDPAKRESGFASPFVLPGGRAVLYTVAVSDGTSRIDARRLDTDGATTVIGDGFAPQYVPPGVIVFARGDRLMAVRFDAASLQTKGAPVEVEQGVLTKADVFVGNFTVAANGTATYVLGHNDIGLNRVVWADRRGTRLGALIDQPIESPRNLRISPDGRRLVLTVGPPANGQLWVYDLSGAKQPMKLTFQDHGMFPVWSPDGKRIAFNWRTGQGAHLSWVAADGTTARPESLTPADLGLAAPLDWSADGTFTYQNPPPHEPARMGVLNLKDGTTRTWLDVPFSDWSGRLSPNGHWMAYATDQTGALEVWVRPFPGPGAPVRVSANGGWKPIWPRDGKEIFFESGSQLLSARVAAEAPDFRTDPPQVLFEGGFTRSTDAALRYVDVAPDGRFLMATPVDPSGSASIVVSPHWDQALKRLLRDE